MFDIGITTKDALITYWMEKNPSAGVFGIGRNTLKAIGKYNREKLDATKCGGISSESNGNGSLMRILPLVHYFYYKKTTKDEIYEIVRNSSSITHAHEISILGCLIYVNYLLDILNGLDKLDAYNNLSKYDYEKYFSIDIINLYERILNGTLPNLKMEDINSSCYVVHTLEAVLWITINANDFKDSIIGAINLGSDTDTIGALVGGISGILYGFSSIPARWLKDLKAKEMIGCICREYSSFLVKEINEFCIIDK